MKISKVDEALLDLQKVQTRILVMANVGEIDAEAAGTMERTIQASVETIRRTLSKATQALRGELN